MTDQDRHPVRRPPAAPETASEAAPPEVVERRPGTVALLEDEAAPGPVLGEFEAMFELAPVAMVLVNRSREVLRVNRAARRLSAPDQAPFDTLPQGVFLCCPNRHDDPDGCGYGPRCGACTMRELIDRSFATRQPVAQIETLAPYATADHVEERWIRVSTSHLVLAGGERTLLCIEDISERRLPPGAPGGRLPPGE